MSDDRADLILTMLRDIRGAITTLAERQEELIERVGRVEREVANLHVDFAGMHLRLDNINRRLESHQLELNGTAIRDQPAASLSRALSSQSQTPGCRATR